MSDEALDPVFEEELADIHAASGRPAVTLSPPRAAHCNELDHRIHAASAASSAAGRLRAGDVGGGLTQSFVALRQELGAVADHLRGRHGGTEEAPLVPPPQRTQQQQQQQPAVPATASAQQSHVHLELGSTVPARVPAAMSVGLRPPGERLVGPGEVGLHTAVSPKRGVPHVVSHAAPSDSQPLPPGAATHQSGGHHEHLE